ncbi:NADH-quinone oxidoreductase subunit J [Actinomadura roseirufa]|uniref:NADH-quinone oxidoreductase subunit J n=1 Tax=Actinomadura roseirufa TaxID=2094049 RepID=UPI0010413B80|nr:NADH-quinone oxidoreductase subunit J [Actinomadura roseirufa]
MQAAGFWVLAVAATGAGAAVFAVDSMARATFALLASFLCAGAELLLAGLSYLGVLVVLMMIMEMLVMAVFMVMYMMNPAGLMPMTMTHNRRGALAVSGTAFAALAAGILTVPWPGRREGPGGGPPHDPTAALGRALMGPKMLVMMVIGVAILATMIATIVLAAPRGRYDDSGGAP